MRLLTIFRHDMRFQFRHGFYYAYLVISLLYILLLHLMPDGWRDLAGVFIIFSDPCGLGFFFVGGLVLLEKDQQTMDALFSTPTGIGEYLWSKALSLTTLAVVTSLTIVWAGVGMLEVRVGVLVIAVFLSALCYTFLGITLAVRVNTLNHYLVGSIIYSVFFLPVLNYLGITDLPILNLLPASASLNMLEAALAGKSLSLFSVSLLLLWVIIGYRWAFVWFEKYIIFQIGD